MAGDSAPREATREEMREAKLPLPYRDSCAGLLIPLNRCRVDTWYLPWKCNVSLSRPYHPPLSGLPLDLSIDPSDQSENTDERHSYEKCQYDEFKKRVAKMNELRAEKGTRSN
ncbi:NADH-ubiquinone oxidoreductase B18 subunit [Colletotrichum abscissum]|uniref:NADH dehydrogenase [ubiquinone] 1 beta subcomplex subunit 7 n=1 Tax=Colletotrichum abscissum TaxID=1671311 RepID=A0A9Q0B3D0_9PEZI|nr:NADH-ubiquinone oxidoreductase B18 subunit [Colletotrichum abscissum]